MEQGIIESFENFEQNLRKFWDGFQTNLKTDRKYSSKLRLLCWNNGKVYEKLLIKPLENFKEIF